MSDTSAQPQITRVFFESRIFAHAGEELESDPPIVLTEKFTAGDYQLTIAYETEQENPSVLPAHPNVVFSISSDGGKPERISLSARNHFSAYATPRSGTAGSPNPVLELGKMNREKVNFYETMEAWMEINLTSIRFLDKVYTNIITSITSDLNLRYQLPDDSGPKNRM